jgi:L-threonylcarbamoyladenylate synthase
MNFVLKMQESSDDVQQLLERGEICSVPTETVYGLAGNAYDDRAIAHIFAIKSRPAFNPLILHYSSIGRLQKDVVWSDTATKLAKSFWPGPLTLVLNRSPNTEISLLASAGLPTIAVRIPAHPIFLELLKTLPFPLAAPSANLSGRLSPTKASHVRQNFTTLPILDGGDCALGIESTVLDLTQKHPILLRPGALPLDAIEAALGKPVESHNTPSSTSTIFHSPGILPSHYAPLKPLRMNTRSVESQERLLAFGPFSLPGSFITLNLSTTSDLMEATSNFFDYLHQLEAYPCGGIAVMPIPEEGLGIAINDRLRRASRRAH